MDNKIQSNIQYRSQLLITENKHYLQNSKFRRQPTSFEKVTNNKNPSF